jgi:hypothetical protein
MRRHPYASAMLAREGSGALAALTEAMAPHVVTLADGSHDIASPGS